MSAWWLIVAFIGGMVFMWKIGYWLLKLAINDDKSFERALSRMSYEALLKVMRRVDCEIAKRVVKQ